MCKKQKMRFQEEPVHEHGGFHDFFWLSAPSFQSTATIWFPRLELHCPAERKPSALRWERHLLPQKCVMLAYDPLLPFLWGLGCEWATCQVSAPTEKMYRSFLSLGSGFCLRFFAHFLPFSPSLRPIPGLPPGSLPSVSP